MIPMRQWLAERCCAGDGAPAAAMMQDKAASDHAAALAEAFARGHAESDAASQELLQRTIAMERAKHLEDMQRAEAKWRAAALGKISEDITVAFTAVHDSLAQQLAAALTGFLEGGAQSKALVAFRAALDDFAETQAMIRIEGPVELLEGLQNLGSLPPGVALKTVEAGELRAVAGDTTIASALRRWLHAIHGDQG